MLINIPLNLNRSYIKLIQNCIFIPINDSRKNSLHRIEV